MTLPSFLGLGAMKAGTSLVHTLLAEHPDVALAAHRKEVMFFDRHWSRGLAWYEAHFDHVGDRVCGEVTPGYLYDPEAPARIHQTLPDARLFVVLRDPVARAESQYRFFVKEHGFAGSVDDYLEEHPNAVARGLYHQQLARYLEHFASEQLLVLLFEDLVADPVAVMARVYAHVGVDPSFVPPSAGERRNASERPRFHRIYTAGRAAIRWLYDHDLAWVVDGAKRIGVRRLFFKPGRADQDFERMSTATRARLAATYIDDARALSGLLDRDLVAAWPSLG